MRSVEVILTKFRVTLENCFNCTTFLEFNTQFFILYSIVLFYSVNMTSYENPDKKIVEREKIDEENKGMAAHVNSLEKRHDEWSAKARSDMMKWTKYLVERAKREKEYAVREKKLAGEIEAYKATIQVQEVRISKLAEEKKNLLAEKKNLLAEKKYLLAEKRTLLRRTQKYVRRTQEYAKRTLL